MGCIITKHTLVGTIFSIRQSSMPTALPAPSNSPMIIEVCVREAELLCGLLRGGEEDRIVSVKKFRCYFSILQGVWMKLKSTKKNGHNMV